MYVCMYVYIYIYIYIYTYINLECFEFHRVAGAPSSPADQSLHGDFTNTPNNVTNYMLFNGCYHGDYMGVYIIVCMGILL